jgi:hypothetical protein
VYQALLAVLVAIFVLTSVSARADEWKKDFTTSGRLTLRVDANDADIRVSSWDRKETQALVITNGYKIAPGEVQVTDRQSGDQVVLEVHKPSHLHVSMGWHDKYVRVEVNVPRDANLDLHTGDGHVRVIEVRGDLKLSSGDGDVEVRSGDGPLKADTHDGNIRAEGRFDALDLHTGDGNIAAQAATGSKISSNWMLRTGDGNVELRIPSGFSADLTAHTGDGHVSVDFPVTVTGAVKENNINGKMNGGGPLLELRTGDGNIAVEKD